MKYNIPVQIRLTERQAQGLDEIADMQCTSRAAIIRQAIKQYLNQKGN